MSKWIYSVTQISPSTCNDAFKSCCHYNYIDLAKWLYDTGKVDIHTDSDVCLVIVCYRGYLGFAKWLHSLGANIHTDEDEPFKQACIKGNEDIINWLYHFGNIDIHNEEDFAFRFAVKHSHKKISLWLYNLGSSIENLDEENAWLFLEWKQDYEKDIYNILERCESMMKIDLPILKIISQYT